MRTIAVVNQKGGCGKTTVSINLAAGLAELGKKTLLVDMDPQSHCAVGLAVPEEQIEQSIYDVLISKSRNEPIKLSEILWQINERLDLAPASIDLSAFEQQMADIAERDCCLAKALEEAKGSFDYVIIDCPPAVGLLTFNALRAATDVIVPVETGYFALHGLSRQLETLSILCERCGHKIIVKVLASMYDIRTKMAREIIAELRSCFGEKMFKTIVNFNTKIKEAASFGQPILEYDPASKGRSDFRALADEVISSETMQQRKELVNSLSTQLESISSSADELLRSTKQSPAAKKPLVVTPPAEKQPVVSSPNPSVPVAMTTLSKPLPATVSIPSPKPASFFAEATKDKSVVSATVSTPVAIVSQTAAKPTVSAQPVESHKSQVASLKDSHEPPITSHQRSTEEKLSDYYGVSQINDAVAFVTLYPRAAKVQIAGDFNNWQPEKTEMSKVGESGVWQAKLKLPPGKHQYRFVVDGQWQQDPYNEKSEINPFGGFNSIIDVK
jgi:chromosome partitioning protein